MSFEGILSSLIGSKIFEGKMKKLKFIFDVFLYVAMPVIGYILGFWLYFWEYVHPKLSAKLSRADETA